MTDYIQLAKELGAASAVRFELADIVFDPRTILKCVYGCKDYGNNHTCPFGRSPLTIWDYEKILKHYSWGVIVGAHDQETTQRITLELERRAFYDGLYMAFSMSDCALCETCAKQHDEPCLYPEKARPAFHSVGIDVFATIRKLSLHIETLRDYEQEQNWYAAVWME